MKTPMQDLLFGLKVEALEKEKKSVGIAKLAMTMQVQMFDTMLQFLASQQTEEDIMKLKLTLAKQATPADDIKIRQDTSGLAEGLIELGEQLKKDWEEEQKRAQKEKRQPRDLKYPLNGVPTEIKTKTVTAKIYSLRREEVLPANIIPASRTIRSKEDAERYGFDWNGEPFEGAFMQWVKNPPPVKKGGKDEEE